MSDNMSPEWFNAMFGEALRMGGEALEKVGQATGQYIQHKLRENSFARKILPPQTVTERECQRSTTQDTLEYIDEIEPDSIAMRINWRGEPDKTWLMGKRYAIQFSTISSNRFQKAEDELLAYRMPLTKVIEQNTVRDIQEQEDKTFMQHVKAALYLGTLYRYNQLVNQGVLATTKNFGTADAIYLYLLTQNKNYNAGTWPGAGIPTSAVNRARGFHSNLLLSDQTQFNRIVLSEVAKVQAARQMKAQCFLMHEYDFTDTVAWSLNEAGLEITSEIVKDGYKYLTIGGYTFVTTVRDNPDLVQPGQIFCFPSPQFLGRFLIINNTKFYINRQGRFIIMEAWETIGAGIGNVLGVSCILLKGAEITIPVVTQTPADIEVARGKLRIINDHTLTAIPAIV
jgi:hypothetical protein